MKHRKVPKAMGRPVNNGRSSATEFTVVSLTCSLTYFHLINVLKTKARLFDSKGEKSSKRKQQPESSH